MRDNWKRRKLNELVIGKGEYGINAAACEYNPKLNTYLRITDISEDGRFLEQGKKSVDHPDAEKFILKDGDIAFARTGASTGKTYLYNRKDGKLIFAGFLIRFKPDPEKLVSSFLKYVTQSYYYKNWVSIYSARTGQPGINGNEYGELKFNLPPLPQQRKIAHILSTCDEVIEKTEAAIAKYQALKQGMMHDLFTRGIDLKTGRLRPSYQEAPELYKESALGWIPWEWEEGSFIDFADERISHSFTGGPFGSDLQTRDYTKEGIRIIQLQNIGDGQFNNGYKIYTSEEKANYLRACNIYPGEIILSKMAEPIARACIIPSYHDRYLMASDGIRLSINKRKFNLRFVLETINQKRFRNIAELRSTGTTRSRIGLTELKEIPVCYPELEEQNLIGKKLDNLEESMSLEKSASAKFQQLKAGLMQDLLTGKVEVNVEEELETINN